MIPKNCSLVFDIELLKLSSETQKDLDRNLVERLATENEERMQEEREMSTMADDETSVEGEDGFKEENYARSVMSDGDDVVRVLRDERGVVALDMAGDDDDEQGVEGYKLEGLAELDAKGTKLKIIPKSKTESVFSDDDDESDAVDWVFKNND
mmetsp:Transcript_9703/g.13364  ORF Transcript_9703/g.13364 Transcript_9703/m.13364 type:complete len:153 (-) Transcript_9703:74-532(-)